MILVCSFEVCINVYVYVWVHIFMALRPIHTHYTLFKNFIIQQCYKHNFLHNLLRCQLFTRDHCRDYLYVHQSKPITLVIVKFIVIRLIVHNNRNVQKYTLVGVYWYCLEQYICFRPHFSLSFD